MKPKTQNNSFESIGCKCYRPGDPEFEALASLVTPLHKIRSEFSGNRTLFYEEQFDHGWRRNESVSEIYAEAASLQA